MNEREYIKDVVDLEGNLYLLKLVRDKLETKADECREASDTYAEKYTPEEPALAECKLKQVPEKPRLDYQSNKRLHYSNKLLSWAIISCIALFIDFIAVLISTKLFDKPYTESGVWGTMLVILVILTLMLVLASVVLRALELRRFNADIDSWMAVKAQIDEYNTAEIARAEAENRRLYEQYNTDYDIFTANRTENELLGRAKASVFELLHARLSTAVMNAEKQLSKLYLQGRIPPVFRRIDIAFILDECMENGASGLSDALNTYRDKVSRGEAAASFGDLFEDVAMYGPKMPRFFEYIVSLEEEADKYVQSANTHAEGIASKAVNKNTGSVNAGRISLEFQRTYDDGDIARLILAVANSNATILENY